MIRKDEDASAGPSAHPGRDRAARSHRLFHGRATTWRVLLSGKTSMPEVTVRSFTQGGK